MSEKTLQISDINITNYLCKEKIHTAKKQTWEKWKQMDFQNFIAQTKKARDYSAADHLKLHKLKEKRELLFLARFQPQSYWEMPVNTDDHSDIYGMIYHKASPGLGMQDHLSIRKGRIYSSGAS